MTLRPMLATLRITLFLGKPDIAGCCLELAVVARRGKATVQRKNYLEGNSTTTCA